MKSIRHSILVAAAIVAAACAKESIPTPTVSQSLVVDQAAGIPLPDGFQNWPRSIFVFDKNDCVRVMDVANEAEMKVKLDVGSGYQVVVLAYDTKDNLGLSPDKAGEPAYRYSVRAQDPTLPLPQLWYAAAKYDKDADELDLSFTPITSTLNIEFETVPSDLDSVTVDIPVSMDTWYLSEQKSEVSLPGAQSKHLVLTPEMMRSKLSMGVFAMLNHNATDSSILRCQVPVCFYYKEQRKPGVIPFKGRIGDAQVCDIVIEDSHETYFDNDFNVRHCRRNMDGTGEVKGSQPLSLWPINYNYEVASDTTSFQMNAGRSFAFQFGSITFVWNDEHTKFSWGDRSKDFNEYAGYGFDFFRIPVDEGWCFFSNGELKPTCKEELKKMADWAIAANTRVIIDLHWLVTTDGDTNMFPHSGMEIRFRNCWRQLHELFKDYDPEYLAYELLNEAAGRDGYYNTFLANAVGMIRSWGGNEVRRKIVCGCPDFQDVSGMKVLELPSDPNLIASFHSYAPVFFCFYGTGFGADYGFDKYTGPCHYPGYMVTQDELKYMQEKQPENYNATIYFRNAYNDRETLYNEFQPAYEAKKRLNVPVWIGEYGPAATGTTKTDRRNLFRDVCSLFRQFGFAHSYWFELDRDDVLDQPDQKILDYIIGNK